MIFYDTFRASAKGGQALHFGGLPPLLLLTIHIANMQLNFITFLTNSSCFQLKSTLEVL